MTREETKKLVHAMVERWNARDLGSYLDLLTDDVVWDDPAMQAPAEGRASVKRFSESVLHAFPDFHYSIRAPLCSSEDGILCAVPWRITATHRKSLNPPGFGPTGQSATFEGVDLLTFRGSRVCRIETLFDVRVPAEQLLRLRIRPPAGSVQERLVVCVQRLRAAWLRAFRKT